MKAEVRSDSGDLTPQVRGLLEKYGKPSPAEWRVLQTPPATSDGALTLVPGWTLQAADAGAAVLPLLPWRNERRFQELKRMVDGRTVESVSMCRFSCSTDGQGMDLAAVLYREFDLAEWLIGAPIAAVAASIHAGRWANIVLRMKSDVVCGVEAAVTLPAGSMMIDRHELIARRGVACDRLVDSQTPQQSVYTFTADGVGQYTDTDAELFGLSIEAVTLVRAAYDALVQPDQADALRRQHGRLAGLVRLAFESDRRCERLLAEGVAP